MFLQNWHYDGGDPGLRLFTLANPLLPDAWPQVLEIGYRDTDWMERARHCDRSLNIAGIDWRGENSLAGGLFRIKGDVMPRDCFRPECVDAVIALSAIEHMGLGHYERDPLHAEGDAVVVGNVREWLKPGGFFYFDVPYAPEGYWVKGTKCRIYDDQALRERFGPHTVLGYTTPDVRGWIEKPTKNFDGPRPFYYVALLLRKER